MLLLVSTDGNKMSSVEQNIRCHQRGIGKKPAVDIFGILGAFIFKLRHAAQFAEHGVAV